MNLMGHARRVEAAVRVAGFLAARAAAGENNPHGGNSNPRIAFECHE